MTTSSKLTIKPDNPALDQYYRALADAESPDALHEGNVRNAFERLLEDSARARSWSLVSEHGERVQSQRKGAHRISYDGVLRDAWKLPHGHWEAKDTDDTLDV